MRRPGEAKKNRGESLLSCELLGWEHAMLCTPQNRGAQSAPRIAKFNHGTQALVERGGHKLGVGFVRKMRGRSD